ncbi:hypothetical protein RIF29_41686 [Crotalaria pallida]|uniref:FAS1 domain-containing protein n=1 Tax=Crotalaria pallida TaxID=3830 RepID=A0AAN9E671_CROPI
MASSISYVAFIFILLLFNCVPVSSLISTTEFDSMLDTLRVRGYNLFCNAIVTSDLQFDLQQDSNTNTSTFTFFAPTDSSLFALDMTQTASSYTDTLRFHVIPRRLTLPQLRILRDGYTLPTLLPSRRVSLTRRAGGVIAVGGVAVVYPGLFYGRGVAVHGLAGILSVRSNAVSGGEGSSGSTSPSPAPVIPPIRSPDRLFFSPRYSPYSSPVLAPVPHVVSFNVTRRRGSPPVAAPVPAPTAVTLNGPIHAPAPTTTSSRKPVASSPSPGNVIVHAPAPITVPRKPPVTAPSPGYGIVNAPSPLNSSVHSPEPEPYRKINPPANSPAVSSPRVPDSTISLPPAGYSETPVPAAVVPHTPKSFGESNLRKKLEALESTRKCVMSSENNILHMQCYAAEQSM